MQLEPAGGEFRPPGAQAARPQRRDHDDPFFAVVAVEGELELQRAQQVGQAQGDRVEGSPGQP